MLFLENNRHRHVAGPAKLTAFAVLSAALASGCGEGQRERGAVGQLENAGLDVYAVNYPLKYFAERIGGDLIRVELPVPADVDPAHWTPDPKDIVAYQGADIILLNGADYAGWIGLASLPESKLVNTSAGFADRYIRIEGAVTHSHGPEGDHSHGETAFTTWLDPTLAVLQAEAIRAALVEAYPEGQASFMDAFESLKRDLIAIDERLTEALAEIRFDPLLASHPVYQYFARRYGLNLEVVHFEPDELSDAMAWSDLQELLGAHPAKWMVWEGEPLPETVARLEALGVKIVVFDPCSNIPEAGDYLSVMQANVRNLEMAFGAG